MSSRKVKPGKRWHDSFVEVESLCSLSRETESVMYLMSPGKGMAVVFPGPERSYL